jgi:diaminopimelate dehydrogenase
MTKVRTALLGFGNVGCAVVEALDEAPDLELAGVVVADQEEADRTCPVLGGHPVVLDLDELEAVDVAILALPSRAVPEVAPPILARSIATVDCYDIHGSSLLELRQRLDGAARAAGTVAVTAAGWDPGTDSLIRAVMEVVAPRGMTYTNFGPGMSMGHTVVAKGCDGVDDALALTLPTGWGRHRRQVYLRMKEGASFDEAASRLAKDPYFSGDETCFLACDDVTALADRGHGVRLERIGSSGKTSNQRLAFSMTVNNPAATAQVLVASARAATRQRPGCYTLLEIPVIDFLVGAREPLLRRLI